MSKDTRYLNLTELEHFSKEISDKLQGRLEYKTTLSLRPAGATERTDWNDIINLNNPSLVGDCYLLQGTGVGDYVKVNDVLYFHGEYIICTNIVDKDDTGTLSTDIEIMKFGTGAVDNDNKTILNKNDDGTYAQLHTRIGGWKDIDTGEIHHIDTDYIKINENTIASEKVLTTDEVKTLRAKSAIKVNKLSTIINPLTETIYRLTEDEIIGSKKYPKGLYIYDDSTSEPIWINTYESSFDEKTILTKDTTGTLDLIHTRIGGWLEKENNSALDIYNGLELSKTISGDEATWSQFTVPDIPVINSDEDYFYGEFEDDLGISCHSFFKKDSEWWSHGDSIHHVIYKSGAYGPNYYAYVDSAQVVLPVPETRSTITIVFTTHSSSNNLIKQRLDCFKNNLTIHPLDTDYIKIDNNSIISNLVKEEDEVKTLRSISVYEVNNLFNISNPIENMIYRLTNDIEQSSVLYKRGLYVCNIDEYGNKTFHRISDPACDEVTIISRDPITKEELPMRSKSVIDVDDFNIPNVKPDMLYFLNNKITYNEKIYRPGLYEQLGISFKKVSGMPNDYDEETILSDPIVNDDNNRIKTAIGGNESIKLRYNYHPASNDLIGSVSYDGIITSYTDIRSHEPEPELPTKEEWENIMLKISNIGIFEQSTSTLIDTSNAVNLYFNKIISDSTGTGYTVIFSNNYLDYYAYAKLYCKPDEVHPWNNLYYYTEEFKEHPELIIGNLYKCKISNKNIEFYDIIKTKPIKSRFVPIDNITLCNNNDKDYIYKDLISAKSSIEVNELPDSEHVLDQVIYRLINDTLECKKGFYVYDNKSSKWLNLNSFGSNYDENTILSTDDDGNETTVHTRIGGYLKHYKSEEERTRIIKMNPEYPATITDIGEGWIRINTLPTGDMSIYRFEEDIRTLLNFEDLPSSKIKIKLKFTNGMTKEVFGDFKEIGIFPGSESSICFSNNTGGKTSITKLYFSLLRDSSYTWWSVYINNTPVGDLYANYLEVFFPEEGLDPSTLILDEIHITFLDKIKVDEIVPIDTDYINIDEKSITKDLNKTLQVKLQELSGLTIDDNGLSVKSSLGLECIENGLAIKLPNFAGLKVDDNGLYVKTIKGLTCLADGLEIKLADNETTKFSGLKLDIDGLSIKTNKGLICSTDGLEIKLTDNETSSIFSGLKLDLNGLSIKNGPGIKSTSNGIEINIKNNSGLILDSNELSIKTADDDGAIKIDNNGAISLKTKFNSGYGASGLNIGTYGVYVAVNNEDGLYLDDSNNYITLHHTKPKGGISSNAEYGIYLTIPYSSGTTLPASGEEGEIFFLYT